MSIRQLDCSVSGAAREHVNWIFTPRCEGPALIKMRTKIRAVCISDDDNYWNPQWPTALECGVMFAPSASPDTCGSLTSASSSCNFRGYPPVTEPSPAGSRSALTMQMSWEWGCLRAQRGRRGARARQWKSKRITCHSFSSPVSLQGIVSLGNCLSNSLSLCLFITLISPLIINLPPLPLLPLSSVHSHFLPVWLIPLQNVFICSLLIFSCSLASVFHY